MVGLFWDFADKVASDRGATRTFEQVYNLLCFLNIPTVPKHGLLVWLISSDLAEWNICTQPDIETLAMHMGVSSEGSSSKRGSPSVRVRL